MGTGRNVPSRATAPSVAIVWIGWAFSCRAGSQFVSASHGSSVTTMAPSRPASSISGTVVLPMYQRFLTSERTVQAIAAPHVAGRVSKPIASSSAGAAGRSGPMVAPSGASTSAAGAGPRSFHSIRTSSGITSRMKPSVRPSFSDAIQKGNSANVIDSTTTLSVGDDISVASVVSPLAPDWWMPSAMGTAQLTHTPSGAPIATPISVFAIPPSNLRFDASGSTVSTRAAKSTPNVIPCLLV